MNTKVIPLHQQAEIRRQFRTARCAFPESVQVAAADAVCRLVGETREFAEAETVAAYLAINGELDVKPLIEEAWSRGKTVYIPVVKAGRGTPLEFRAYMPDTPLELNWYGIPEPQSNDSVVDVRQLDLVLCPLVAYDNRGTRIGMGGGYYDATFAYRLAEPAAGPLMLGVGYAAQQVKRLERNPWDVPLDGVATEKEIRWFSGAGNRHG